MDVERIQKVNDLALNLMKQGLAQTREDALQQAEKIFQGKAGDYSELRETMQGFKTETQKESSPDLSQAEIKSILEQNTKFLVKTIKGFQAQMEAMGQEITSLRARLAQRPPHSEPRFREAVATEPAAPEQSLLGASVPSKKGSSEDHPRSGSYNDEDVSIEKFFYTGNK